MAKARFRYLSHTADVEFVAYGKNLKEAIENSALALLNIALDLKKINGEKAEIKSIQISETADTAENLVWFVLQDILSKKSAGYLSAFKFEVQSLKEEKKRVSLKGKLFHKKLKKDYTTLDIKAVTPHDLKVSKSKKGYSINVIVDV